MEEKSPITSIDLDRLEALAKAATPGPWFWNSYSGIQSAPRVAEYNRIEVEAEEAGRDLDEEDFPEIWVCSVPKRGRGDEATEQGQHDARFIEAANPEVIVALIAAVRGR